MSYDILVEDFGGDVQCAQVSAKKGMGVDELLDKVLLQADVMNLKSAVDCKASGTVIEARVDKGLGVIATCLVQSGTLRIGDIVLAGPSWGRVRRIISDAGKDLKEAGPSTPVQLVGLTGVPNAGDAFSITADENGAREVAEARQRIVRQAAGTASSSAILAQAINFAEGNAMAKEIIKVPIVIKADVAGSVEALRAAIDALQISDDESTCKADIVYAGVGDVTSSDVAVAAVSKGKIVAFNVAAASNAMNEARASNVAIGYYSVVYELLEELEKEIKTTLAPPPPGTLVGKAEIKKIFKLGKVGKVAGCTVIEGMLKANSQVRIMRGKRNPVYTGALTSLKVVKEAVTEVPTGSECGTSFEDFQVRDDSPFAPFHSRLTPFLPHVITFHFSITDHRTLRRATSLNALYLQATPDPRQKVVSRDGRNRADEILPFVLVLNCFKRLLSLISMWFTSSIN